METTEPVTTGADWLLSALPTDEDRHHAWEQWNGGRPALIPTGVTFDALVLPTMLGRAVLDRLGREDDVTAPVLYGIPRHMFLVPVGTAQTWDEPGTARTLGEGAWLAAPQPGSARGAGPVWTVEPDGSGRLHDPDVLRAAFRATAHAHIELSAQRRGSGRP